MAPIGRKITFKYLSALLLVGALLFANYFAFTSYFKTMKNDGLLINISGRQRMLSQRIAFMLNEYSRETLLGNIEDTNRRLDYAIELMEQTHGRLVVQASLSSALHEIYFGSQYALDKKVREFIARSRAANTRHSGKTQSFTLQEISLLLAGLDRAVSAFEEINTEHNHTLAQIQGLVLILGVLMLILTGIFIFRPMTMEIADKAEEILNERMHVNLLLEIAVIANESKNLHEAIESTLHQVCVCTGWPVGHAYAASKDDPDLLLPTKIWYLNDSIHFHNFKEITELTPLRRGVGLPGRVLESRKVAWIFDVKEDQNFPRNKIAADIGVRSAFAFPILWRGSAVAVLEFFLDHAIEKDDSLLSIISHVGQQLGQVYEREEFKNEIQQLNHSLEQRVETRSQELHAKNEELAMQQLTLVNSSKMAALGEMAGGVAHEINNPLAAIKSLSSQLQEVADEEPLDKVLIKDMAAQVEATTNRITKIIQGLRTFSRDGSKDPYSPVNIHQMVQETLTFCSERLKSNHTNLVIEEFGKNLHVDGRATELSQVLLNLLNNANDAISNLDEKWIKIFVTEDREWVEVLVKDSGKGVPLEVREKIFQPFFTTKEVGKGTGMGLSISAGIVQSHGGQLRLDTQCANTCFVIRLPKVHKSTHSSSVA